MACNVRRVIWQQKKNGPIYQDETTNRQNNWHDTFKPHDKFYSSKYFIEQTQISHYLVSIFGTQFVPGIMFTLRALWYFVGLNTCRVSLYSPDFNSIAVEQSHNVSSRKHFALASQGPHDGGTRYHSFCPLLTVIVSTFMRVKSCVDLRFISITQRPLDLLRVFCVHDLKLNPTDQLQGVAFHPV